MAGMLLLGMMCTLTSAAPSTPPYQYVRTTFGTVDGLPQTSVKDILQSHDGYLWVATQEGLARFDGVKFTVYNTRNAPGLVSNNLHQLVEDGAGSIWILAGSGVTRYQNGVFDDMTPDCDRAGERINYLFKSTNGKVYAASDTQILRADSSRFVPIADLNGSLHGGPWYFADQPDGTIWVAGAERHIMSIRGSVCRNFVVPGKNGDETGGLAVDKKGVLWIAGTGLWYFDSNAGTFRQYISGVVTGDRRIDAINADPNGVLRFAIKGAIYETVTGHIPHLLASTPSEVRWCAFGADGSIWQLLPKRTGDVIWRYLNGRTTMFDVGGRVTTEWTLPVTAGTEGNVWVGTYNGLAEYRQGRCVTIGHDAGVPDGWVWSIHQMRNGQVYVGADGPSFGTLTGDRYQPFADPNLRNANVASIAEDGDGVLWVSTDQNQLWKREPGKRAVNARPVLGDNSPNSVTAMDEGVDGSLWCSDGDTLARIVHGKRVDTYSLKTIAGEGGRLYDIRVTHDGRLWLGFEKGFACLNHGAWRYFGPEVGMPSVPVVDICEDHTGDVWLAFWGGGLARYHNDQFAFVTLRDGLFSDSVQSVVEGGNDELWMGTSNGICSVSRTELDRYIDGDRTKLSFKCRTYSTEDGSSITACTGGRQPIAQRVADGSMWFAGYGGAVHVAPTAPLFHRDHDLPVWIESAIVDGRSFVANRFAEASAGPGNLEFDYTAVTFHDARKVTFRYRLEGFDQGWVDAGDRRVAYYTHVPPGRYKFRVVAVDSYGNQNESAAVFEFALKPHYYETAWFRVLCILIALVLTSGVGILRSYQLQRRNKILEERVQERTQDLEEANRELSDSREEAVAQNEMLQSIQAELEAQNQELVDSRALLANQNEQLHEMKAVLENRNQDLADANDRLEDLATIDGLTGLKNHRSFQVKLDTEIKFSLRHNTPLSLIILDVDSFKTFNDTYGHPAGDEVLKQVARILSDTARDLDFVARYGGEEFVIILPVTDTEGAMGVAERFREAIELWPWAVRQITASFGVSALTLDVESAADFVDRADQALYFSKKSGKNMVTSFNTLTVTRA